MDVLIWFWEYVLPFLVILSVVVFVHEFGHFLVARWNGVRVEVFSIGFGTELFGRTDRNGTRWKVCLIPLGGYVKMFGDADATSATQEPREMTPEELAVSFHGKRVWQRMAIVAAGPLTNFAFAVLVFALMFMTVGQPTTPPVVGEVIPDSAAAAAGFQVGDRVVSIDGAGIERFTDIQRIVQLSNGRTLTVVVSRGEAPVTIAVAPRISETTDNFGNSRRIPLLGLSVSRVEQAMVRHGPLSAVVESVRQTYTVVEATLVAVGQMIAGTRGTDELGGPLRIAQFSGQAAQTGWINFVMFIAILSVNLGLINLFPIPMLDGGHLLFYSVEAARGRPLTERTQEYGLRIGLVLVFALMVFATWNDLIQLKVWDFLVGLVS
ncbi:MAG: RIP metalloprotease RseP [Alphaproteobacteria bacterium]